jgi:hypothetical protein
MLEDAFRKIRESWFNRHLYSRSSEREWEDEDRELSRNESNKYYKEIFDQDTEDIILGKNRCISPTSIFEMQQARKEKLC